MTRGVSLGMKRRCKPKKVLGKDQQKFEDEGMIEKKNPRYC